DFDPTMEAIVSNSAGLADESSSSRSPQMGYVNATERSPGVVQIDVDCGTTRQFLVRSAAYYPGWTVTIDGTPSLVERTNHAFQGVVVPAGKHSIVFEYKPFVFRLGLFISLFAGSLVSAGLGMGLVLRKRTLSPAATGI